MNERTGTGVTPERTGLSELEKRQDEGTGSKPAGDVGGYGSSSGYDPAGAGTGAPGYGGSGYGGSGEPGYGGEAGSQAASPEDVRGPSGASFGSGTVIPEESSGVPAVGAGGGREHEGAREHVKRVRGMAAGRFQRTLEHRKSFFASELENYAGIFEDVGRTLEERGRGSQKKVTDAAARMTRRASRTLRERSTDEIFDSVRGELRDRPAVVFAGALALGFLGARLLRD